MKDVKSNLAGVSSRPTILMIQGTTRLNATLQEMGSQIVTVESMARAAQDLAAGRLKPDVVLVQSDIGSLDALTAFQRISEANVTGAPIIFLGTAADRKKLLEVMWLGGLFDFVTEPFESQDLRQRVQQAIAQHQKNLRAQRRAKKLITPASSIAGEARERQLSPSRGSGALDRERSRSLL